MFKNIGSKIKNLAIVNTVIGFVLSFVYFICIGIHILLEGIIILIIGCLLSWIGSFLLYGFGELIEKNTEIANNSKKQADELNILNNNLAKLLNNTDTKTNVDIKDNVVNTTLKLNNKNENYIGKYVNHKKYGKGMITSYNEKQVKIVFLNHKNADICCDINTIINNEDITIL